jgi:hypothetical protein
MKIYFFHYGKIFPSLWKFPRITMEFFMYTDRLILYIKGMKYKFA